MSRRLRHLKAGSFSGRLARLNGRWRRGATWPVGPSFMFPSPETHLPTNLRIALAWLPFLLLWALFVQINANVGILVSLRSGLVSIGTAAALGQGVWWATGRITWPDSIRPDFYGVHAALATAYAFTWLWAVELFSWTMSGESLPGVGYFLRVWEWENWGWRLLMGLWLYGLVAGVCYGLRIRSELRDQERASARLEALATHARLESLRARLNPHFLFNALNSVAALIPEEPAAAEDAVERLGRLLRYTLAESDGPVPFADEWAFTSSYLDIEALRLEDRLRVELDLNDEAMSVPVPPFSLQTLVENAVRHAAATQVGGARVLISARVVGSSLALTVADDGPGADASSIPTRGTGLSNLRERLRGRYGSSATLEVRSEATGGFTATLVLPTGLTPLVTPRT